MFEYWNENKDYLLLKGKNSYPDLRFNFKDDTKFIDSFILIPAKKKKAKDSAPKNELQNGLSSEEDEFIFSEDEDKFKGESSFYKLEERKNANGRRRKQSRRYISLRGPNRLRSDQSTGHWTTQDAEAEVSQQKNGLLAQQQRYIEDQAQRDFLRKESYNDVLKQEKLDILRGLREVKHIKRKVLEYNLEQDEKFTKLEEETNFTLQNMKKTNKNLAEAYYYDTKSGTAKITAGTTGKAEELTRSDRSHRRHRSAPGHWDLGWGGTRLRAREQNCECYK